MQCPQCSSALEPLEYEGAPIHGCNTCGGEFIGAEDLGRIVRLRHEQFSDELQTALAERQPSFGVPESETARALCCPGPTVGCHSQSPKGPSPCSFR